MWRLILLVSLFVVATSLPRKRDEFDDSLLEILSKDGISKALDTLEDEVAELRESYEDEGDNGMVSDPFCRDDWETSECKAEPEACYYKEDHKKNCRLTCNDCGFRDEVDDKPEKKLIKADETVSDMFCGDDWGTSFCQEPEACFYDEKYKEGCRRSCNNCVLAKRDENAELDSKLKKRKE